MCSRLPPSMTYEEYLSYMGKSCSRIYQVVRHLNNQDVTILRVFPSWRNRTDTETMEKDLRDKFNKVSEADTSKLYNKGKNGYTEFVYWRKTMQKEIEDYLKQKQQ